MRVDAVACRLEKLAGEARQQCILEAAARQHDVRQASLPSDGQDPVRQCSVKPGRGEAGIRFGQDRFETLKWRMDQKGLRKR